MDAILSLLLPAVVPAGIDFLKSIVYKITGISGAEPKTVDDAIRMKQAEVEKLRALAELDKPWGEVSRWVADLRASWRYICASIIILVSMFSVIAFPDRVDVNEILLNLAGSVFSFMFGDRVYFHLKSK